MRQRSYRRSALPSLIGTLLTVGLLVACDPGTWSYKGTVEEVDDGRICVRPDDPSDYDDTPKPVQVMACGEGRPDAFEESFEVGDCVIGTVVNFLDDDESDPPEGDILWNKLRKREC